MTHDELDWKLSHYNYMESGDLIKALRAVVELHRNVDGACWECQDAIYHEYPCPTIQAIEKELR
jgi:hypothetical protein